MSSVNYQKIIDYLVNNQPCEIEKIKRVVTDAKCAHRRATIPFEKIIVNKDWDASQKETLLRLFEYQLRDNFLEYYDKNGCKNRMLAIFYTAKYGNVAGFTALIRTLRDCESREFKDKYEAYLAVARIIVEDKLTNQSELLGILLDSLTYDEMKEILRDHFNIKHYGLKHESLFHYIIASQDLYLIKRCIPFVKNIDLYLSSAVSTGNKSVVDLFLSQGANINFSGVPLLGMVSPLKTAIIKNDFEMLKYLIEKGANVLKNDSLGEVENRIIAQFGIENRKIIEGIRKEGSSSMSFIVSSSPLIFACTFTDKICDTSFSSMRITFKGSLPYMPHYIIQNHSNTAASRRVAIADYLYFKTEDKSAIDMTQMLMISLIDEKVDTFKKYVDLSIKESIPIDLVYLFHVFFELEKHTNDNIEFCQELIRLIKHKDEQLLILLFKTYQSRFLIKSNSLFVTTILETMTQEMRNSLCIVPHVKDLTTLNYLIGLGYSIKETDEKGNDILLNLMKEEHFFLDIPEENLFAYLIENTDLSKKDSDGHSALYYAIGKINTIDEYRWSRSTPCTKYELLVARMISNMKPEDVCTDDIMSALETKSKQNRASDNSIDYSFVFTHHQSLMTALLSKGFKLSDFILRQIFDRIYTGDECSIVHCMDKKDVDDTLAFIYGSLDKDTSIQKDSIMDIYEEYLNRLKEGITFDEYMILLNNLKKLISSLKNFYSKHIKKKYDPNKYLAYVKEKYNVDYSDLKNYLLKFMLIGLEQYGSDKLESILAVYPSLITHIIQESDIGINWHNYYDTFYQYDEESEEMVPDEEKFDAKNVSTDNHDNIIFTGGFIQYAILKDNLDLVVKLLDRGAKLELEIDGENHTWDYVHSKKMRAFMESILGPMDFGDMSSDEKSYLLEIMNNKPKGEKK